VDSGNSNRGLTADTNARYPPAFGPYHEYQGLSLISAKMQVWRQFSPALFLDADNMTCNFEKAMFPRAKQS
jgi:hypothetical protein